MWWAIAASSFLLFAATTTCICHGYDPAPAPWPEQFHAILFMNLTDTGKLVVNDLWYDWPNGRNFNILQRQLEEVLYDLEWNNGTSYYYTLGRDGETCRTIEFGVGIPRPDWLTRGGANYLGQVYIDGFLCNAWEKLQFIWYYEDVVSKRPVRWDFFDGITNHVMTFEVGAVLEDSHWQAPSYCFGANIEMANYSEYHHQVPSSTRRLAWISAANQRSI